MRRGDAASGTSCFGVGSDGRDSDKRSLHELPFSLSSSVMLATSSGRAFAIAVQIPHGYHPPIFEVVTVVWSGQVAHALVRHTSSVVMQVLEALNLRD